MGRLCSLKRSLRHRGLSSLALGGGERETLGTLSTLNHVNHIRRFTSNVRFDLIHLSSTITSILRAAIFDIRAGGTIIFIAPKRAGRKP